MLSSQKSHLLITLAPSMLGNPGLVEYYTPFLQSVYDTCQERIDIFGGNLLHVHVCHVFFFEK